MALVDSKMDLPIVGLTARNSGCILNRNLPAGPRSFVVLMNEITDDIVQFCIRVNPQAHGEITSAHCRGHGGGQLQKVAATIKGGRGLRDSSWPRRAPIDAVDLKVPLVARGIARLAPSAAVSCQGRRSARLPGAPLPHAALPRLRKAF